MTIRLAVPEEAETLWHIRNAAIQQGFRVIQENRYHSKMARADLRCFDMECELIPGE